MSLVNKRRHLIAPAAGATLLAAVAGGPAAAASTGGSSQGPSSTHQLASLTDGHENAQIKALLPQSAVLKPPQLGSTPPVTGGSNPGATLGQGIKSLASTDHLSAASAAFGEQEVKQALAGKTPSAAAASAAVSQQGIATPLATTASNTVQGMDVSGWDPTVDWSAEYAAGARFVYIKATEGTSFTSSAFSNQYIGATNAHFLRGGYHFAIPTQSSGAVQADYFATHGGGWSADGQTLPGLLDIEYNPYSSLGNTCYNLSNSQMLAWVNSFAQEYKKDTGRYPAVYSTTDWLNTCIGSANVASLNYMPLFIARYASTAGVMPAGWTTYDLWQYSSNGPFTGDSDLFNGTAAQLAGYSSIASYAAAGGPQTSGTYVAPSGNAVNLSDPIGAYWNKARSTYGLPTGNETTGLPGGGSSQMFANGYAIYSSSWGTYAFATNGLIYKRWQSVGGVRGYLGLPTSNVTTLSSGTMQNFHGGSIFANAAGTATYVVHGGIASAYTAAGGVKGALGAATSDEAAAGAGVVQHFAGGDIYWSSATGAHAMLASNPISTRWQSVGGVGGYLGLPSSDVISISTGSMQNFHGGSIFANAAGTATYVVHGGIAPAYTSAGGVNGVLGAPTSDEISVPGGVVQHFQHGDIYWTPGSGCWVVRGGIGAEYAATGGASGFLRLPTSAEVAAGGAQVQTFQGGRINWTSATGAHAVHGAILVAYAATGYQAGELGNPTTDEVATSTGTVQHFQHGTITWTKATSKTTVTIN